MGYPNFTTDFFTYFPDFQQIEVVFNEVLSMLVKKKIPSYK